MTRPTVLVLAHAQDPWLPKLASLGERARCVSGDSPAAFAAVACAAEVLVP